MAKENCSIGPTGRTTVSLATLPAVAKAGEEMVLKYLHTQDTDTNEIFSHGSAERVCKKSGERRVIQWALSCQQQRISAKRQFPEDNLRLPLAQATLAVLLRVSAGVTAKSYLVSVSPVTAAAFNSCAASCNHTHTH